MLLGRPRTDGLLVVALGSRWQACWGGGEVIQADH